jgi:ubiquinone/menaquinone biosynthesis C-methylase UbiE
MAGLIMTRTPSNWRRIQWTLSLLDLKPTDCVLEIGPGPGVATQLVSRITTSGHVVAVDHSEVMVRQASRRNARAIRDGRVEFRVGSASALPHFDRRFDKIFTINSIHFWSDPVQCLSEMRELLKPGGVIAVTLQPRSRSATDAIAEDTGREVVANLERAGFSRTRLEILPMRPVAVACALGFK